MNGGRAADGGWRVAECSSEEHGQGAEHGERRHGDGWAGTMRCNTVTTLFWTDCWTSHPGDIPGPPARPMSLRIAVHTPYIATQISTILRPGHTPHR